MASWSVRFGGVRGVVGCVERARLDAALGVLHDLVGDLIWRWLGLVVAHRGMVAPTNSRRNGGPVAAGRNGVDGPPAQRSRRASSSSASTPARGTSGYVGVVAPQNTQGQSSSDGAAVLKRHRRRCYPG